MKKLFALFIGLSLTPYCFSAVQKKTVKVYFNSAGYALSDPATRELNRLLQHVDPAVEYEIFVSGHTDDVGDSKYNKKLSQDRAKSVAQYLTKQGIPADNILIEHYGELKPEFPNYTEAQRRQNRRVEVTLHIYRFDNTGELQEALKNNTEQEFIINPVQRNVINGRKGVTLVFNRTSLVYEDGSPVTEPVTIQLNEALDFNSFVGYNLSTRSGDQMIESGGMFQLTATTQSGRKVKVNPNDPLVASVPTANRKNDMQVFVSNSNGTNWNTTGDTINGRPQLALAPIPERMTSNLILPQYVPDYTGKPEPPRKPRNFKAPAMPRKESYIKEPKWYQLNKSRVIEKGEMAYEAALSKYESRHTIYVRRAKRYEKGMGSYIEDTASYRHDLQAWEMNQDSLEANFERSDEYVNAHEAWRKDQDRLDRIYRCQMEEWQADKSEQIEKWAEKMDQLGTTNQSALQNYVFAVRSFGWINVDRFCDYKGERFAVILDDVDTTDEQVFVLYAKRNSLLSLQKMGNMYVQQGLPKEEQAKLFAFKVVDGKPQIYIRELNGGVHTSMEFRESSFREIKAILNQVGG